MMTHLHALAALCSAAPDRPALFLAMLVAGLAGSVAHCVPMCGPFVLGQVGDRLATLPALRLCEATRLRGALLLPYHAGRLLTYCALGAGAAVLGTAASGFAFVPALLLAGAAAVFFIHAARRLWPGALVAARPARRPPAPLATLIARSARRIDRTRPSGGLLLGLLLGFLPCGLLYAALVAAAATQSAWAGAAAMAAFGLGTVPSLVMVGVAGHSARRLRPPWWPRGLAGPLIMLANAMVLLALAGRLLASAV